MLIRLLSIVVVVVSLTPALRAQKTVQLPFAANDNSGSQWVLQQMGFLSMQGNQPIFGQAGMITINGQGVRWRENQAQQDEKTGEIILGEATSASLQVQRRVYFDSETGQVRIVDVLSNSTNRDINVNVQLQSSVNFGLNAAGTITDAKGKNNPPIAWAGQTPVGRTALSIFAGKGAKTLPNLQYQQGNNIVQAQIPVRIPAGKTAAVAHLHQVVGTQEEAAAYVKDMREAMLFRYLPASVRKAIVNFPVGGSFVGEREVLRGDTFDVIELRSGDLLKGTLQQPKWSLTTFYGLIELPPERVNGVINIGQFRPRQLLFTDKGEIFSGQLSGDVLAITLSGGQELKVPFSQIARVGYRVRDGQDDDAEEGSDKPMLVLRSGDRILVEAPTDPIEVFTRYGQLKLPPKSVVSIQFQSEEHGVHDVMLVDGSKFQGLVSTPSFRFKLAGAASGQQIDVSQPAMLALVLVPDEAAVSGETPVCRLVNGDLLAGRLEGSLKLEAAFDTLDLPGQQVRSVARRGEEGSDVQVSMWDGTSVSGQLDRPTMQLLLSGGTPVEVPLALLERYDNPRPRPADAMVQRVREIVGRLSADDFKDREAAERELVKLGPAIIPVLRELRDAQGPEAQSRIEAVLKTLESVKSDGSELQPRRERPNAVRFNVRQVEQGVVVFE